MHLNQVVQQIGQWADDTFRHSNDPAARKSVAAHLAEEAVHLAQDPLSSEEMADVFILLCSSAFLSGVDLEAAIQDKMTVNLTRRWLKADGRGVIRHV